jgi:heme-degrading monooxygenase HmoA
MMRVVYRWKVRAGQESNFRATWDKATTQIREKIRGARGSLLLHSRQQPSEFFTIARWDSFEDWQTFWQGAPPSDMQPMHALADLLSTEAFEEIQDHTV